GLRNPPPPDVVQALSHVRPPPSLMWLVELWCKRSRGWEGSSRREEEKVEMELPNHAKQLLLQLNQQRAKGFLCDVIIVVENALFRAHKNILAASSMYFKSLILHDNLINLDTDMVNPTVFRQILDFIYTGKLLATDQSGEQNFNALLTAASYLQLHDLAAFCRKKLKRNGKPLPAKAIIPSVGRLVRNQRHSATPVIQARYSGSSGGAKTPRSSELQKEKASEEEIYISSSNAECSNIGNSSNNGSNSTNGSSAEQELGLDLSKKSPLVPTAHSQEEMHLNESQQDSPQSASTFAANSASFDDSAANPQNAESSEPMEMDTAEESNPVPETGQQQSLRHPTRKKEWIKKESQFDRQEGGNGDVEGSSLPNGVIVGPLVNSGDHNLIGIYNSEQSYPCKEEVENGKDNSEESCHSENESGQTSANYIFRQEGFEPVAYGDNLYVCIPCGKGFPSSEQLNAHVETHTEEELYIKEEDSYIKEQAEDLTTQSPSFGTDSRPFKCSVCEKSYKDPATLRQHEKTHWLTRPFPCNI
uniref:HIC ZBTB transcriptional repressor 2 n=1 Tax=Latimeria chalumnae TaxID=7897 RepID=H3AV05_LATCH